MLPTGHLLAFALLSFVLIIVPGPNVIFVITRSLMLVGRGSARPVGHRAGVHGPGIRLSGICPARIPRA
jgi:threonine/homoserine/homoserine lactone efflux protein